MVGCDSMDQVDCGSFFNEIEFPDENLRSVSYNDYQTIWPGSNTIFSGSNSSNNYNSNGTSDLFAELFVPYEDIVQLEWLSNFVEDSFSGGGMTLDKENTSSTNKADPSHNQFQTSSPISVLDSSSSSSSSSSNASLCLGDKTVTPSLPIQTQRGPQRARSKRPRPPTFNPRPKIQLISPTSSITENPQSLSESENFVESHPMKKVPKALTGERKKKRTIKLTIPVAPREVEMDENMNQNQNPPSQAIRKCMHCEITKTPQWRAGPMGPKTLCNACGVRYKSGRLFPEYRPAASPTFSPTIHSNSHKKVLEMRTKGDNSTSITITAIATPPDLIPNTNPSLDYARGE